MAKVNGQDIPAAGLSVRDLLKKMDFDEAKVVVERNLKIVPKASYDETFVSEADEIEVVSFVGGG